jgi:hypothetical protein
MEVHSQKIQKKNKIEVKLQRMTIIAKVRRWIRRISNAIIVKNIATLQVNAKGRRFQDSTTMKNPKWTGHKMIVVQKQIHYWWWLSLMMILTSNKAGTWTQVVLTTCQVAKIG